MTNVFKLLPLGDWLWIGLIASIVGYHVVTLERAKIETRAADKAHYEQQIAAANAQAKADHDALQDKINKDAGTSNADIAAKQAQILNTLRQLGAGKVYANQKPLPAGCVYDDNRVSSANTALQN